MANEIDAFEEFAGFEFSDGKPILPLTDEETGEERKLRLVARTVVDGQLYYALQGMDDEDEEYWMFKVFEDGDDIRFEGIEDDDEYEKLEDIFNDMLFEEDIDYDE